MLFLIFSYGCSSSSNSNTDITWTKDVQPIVEQHCVRCHQDSGQGTGDFTNFEDVKTLAPAMLNSIDSGTMPPPAANPDCRNYLDSDKLHLPSDSRDIIAAWIDAGLPYGEEADAQEYDRTSATLTDPDLVITLQEVYTPSFEDSNNPGNEYRCFSIEHNQTEPFYITSLYPMIDNIDMVHHIVLAKGTEEGILEGSKRPEGVDCIGNGTFGSGNFNEIGMLGAWAPGMSPVRFDDDAGLLVRPNEYIVLQMHYFQTEDATDSASDQSGYAFDITFDAPEHVIQMAPLGIFDFTIPAGDGAYTISDSLSLPLDVTLWGVFPHMHALGAGYSMQLEDQCIVESEQYDFDNQLTYMFNAPIDIPADTRIYWSCTWDNSASNPNIFHNPPIEVGYGERTDEEMCFAFSLISF